MKLIIEDDDGQKTVVPFAQDEISIGREPGNTIRLTERNVSRRHAMIVRRDDSIVIEDLDSFNGVRVNGDRIQGHSRLSHGDRIQIGDYGLAIDDETRPEVPERPTQPELTAVPDRAGRSRRDDDFPFTGNEAVARFQKAAAIQALLAKGRSSPGNAPLQAAPAAASAKEAWPDDFHFVAPGSVEQMKATEIRRRNIILGAVIGSVAILATILAVGFWPSTPVRTTGTTDPGDAVVEPDAVPPTPAAPEPTPELHAAVASPVPPVSPVHIAPAPVPSPHENSSVAPASAPEPHAQITPPEHRAKAARVSTSEASHHKALDLYQDAFADVGNGDYSDALAKLQTSIELDPTSPAAQKEIAICYSHLRQPDKGAAHYEQYLKLRPDAPDAADVRKMLSDYRASKENELIP